MDDVEVKRRDRRSSLDCGHAANHDEFDIMSAEHAEDPQEIRSGAHGRGA